MPKILRPLDVYKYLPQTNCGECGESSCMAFAAKLIERQVSVEKCSPLSEPRYSKKLKALLEVLRSPVKEVTIGVPPNAITIGGKDVMYRHELTWRHPTALMIDVHDGMAEEELIKRVKFVNDFSFIRIGRELKLDGIAVRCVSGDSKKFSTTVSTVLKHTQLPLVLCSYNPTVLEVALTIAGDKKPLIYAANKQNWKEMAELSSKYKCPLVVSAPGDLSLLKSLIASIKKYYNLDDFVLDPGTFVDGGTILDTISTFTALRYAAIEGEDSDVGYPLLGVPVAVWSLFDGDDDEKRLMESIVASSLMSRYADILILHSIDVWPILPVIVWRDCVYTDPRVPPSVKPGLYEIGKPNEMSPLLVTANFALTYYIVKDDVERNKIDAWLVVVDTEGTSVQSAVAGKKLTAENIYETIVSSGAMEKVKHKTVIIPGYAARLSGELEDLLKDWRVFVGPRDSADIKPFLEKIWKKEVFGEK